MFIVQEDYFLVDASLHDFHMQYDTVSQFNDPF